MKNTDLNKYTIKEEIESTYLRLLESIGIKGDSVDEINNIIKNTKAEVLGEALKCAGYALIRYAAGREIEITEFMLKLATEFNITLRDIINAYGDWASILSYAVCRQNLEGIKLLFRLTDEEPDLQKLMLIQSPFVYAPEYSSCANIAQLGNTEIIQLMIQIAKKVDTLEDMIQANNFEVFHSIKAGNYGIVKLILDATKGDTALQQAMIHSQDDHAFSVAQKKGHTEILTLLKFVDALNNRDVDRIKSLTKEHQKDVWFREIIHSNDDAAIKLMTGEVVVKVTEEGEKLVEKYYDIEGMKSLFRIDLGYNWSGLDNEAKKIAEPYSFDPENIVDLFKFGKIHELLKSQKHCLSKDLKNIVVSFLDGIKFEYIPHMLKALQGMENDFDISKDFNKFMEKYEYSLEHPNWNPNWNSLDWFTSGYNLALSSTKVDALGECD